MIDTTDLISYYPGYDDYCEPKEIEDNSWDLADIYHDEMMIRKELEKMERKIIDLSITNMTLEESLQLENYVWKGNLLIPQEMIGE